MKTAARRLAAATIAAAAIALPATTHAQAPNEAIMAVPVSGLAFGLGYLADDLNLWEKHGIKVKTVQISGIGAMNAVIAGSADFTQSSGSAVTRAAARGQRLLGIVGTINRPSAQIALRKELAEAAGYDPKAPLAKRSQALRGLTIAVDAVNSVIHAYLRYIATKAGFNPEEIRVAVMQPPNMLAAFQAKQIDGLTMAPPWVQGPIAAGTAVMIASGPDGDPQDLWPFANTMVATKPETCVKRRALCEAVGRTFRDAVAFLHDKPNEANAILKKRYPQLDDRQFALAMQDTRKITPRDLMLSPAGFENAERFNIEAGLLKPDEKLKSYDNLFTDEFVR
jgi:NitT/TauT family transport system substrate-binding protein